MASRRVVTGVSEEAGSDVCRTGSRPIALKSAKVSLVLGRQLAIADRLLWDRDTRLLSPPPNPQLLFPYPNDKKELCLRFSWRADCFLPGSCVLQSSQ